MRKNIYILLITVSFCALPSCVVYTEWYPEADVYNRINIETNRVERTESRLEAGSYTGASDVIENLFDFDIDSNYLKKKFEVYFSFCRCPSHGINKSNLPDRTLEYNFYISSPYDSSLVIPNVKLNFFSFTDEKGDTIPTVLYVQLMNYKRKVIIDTLLEALTEEAKNKIKYSSINITAESNQSCYDTKLFYVNYDIEVGNKRYVRSIKYKKKWIFDINLR